MKKGLSKKYLLILLLPLGYILNALSRGNNSMTKRYTPQGSTGDFLVDGEYTGAAAVSVAELLLPVLPWICMLYGAMGN